MTLTKESEALLESAAYVCNELDWKCVPLAGLADRLAAIEAAVRAEQAAELAEVRDQLDALLANGPEPRIWLEYRREAREHAAEVERLRAALKLAVEFVDRVQQFGRLTRADAVAPGPMEMSAAVLATTLRAALAATPAVVQPAEHRPGDCAAAEEVGASPTSGSTSSEAGAGAPQSAATGTTGDRPGPSAYQPALAATPVAPAPAATGEGQTPVAPAPNSAPNPTAPHRCRECDDGPNLSFPEPTHAPPAPGER